MDKTGIYLPPQLLTVVNFDYHKDPGEHVYHNPYHVILLLLEAEGYGRSHKHVLPKMTPYLFVTGADEDNVNAYHGQVTGWWITFTWPELSLKRKGRSHLEVGYEGQQQVSARCKSLSRSEIIPLVDHFRRIERAFKSLGVQSQLKCHALFSELFRVYLEFPDTRPTPGHRSLVKFHAALGREENLTTSIEDLAAECGGTADHLRELFKERYGLTPHQYRTLLQLHKARDLLGSTDMNVSEVARRCGYEDPLYFSRQFKKHLGLAPSQVIRQHSPF